MVRFSCYHRLGKRSTDTGSTTKTSAHRFYCALHGFNITHNGVNCTHMLRDSTTYTQRHLNAKKPSDCSNPDGNDHIQFIRPPPRLH